MGSVSRDGASQQRMISATQNSPKRPNCVKFKRWHWDYRQIWLLPSICCHFHPDQYKTHWTLHCIGDEEAILKAMHPLSHKLQSDKFSNSLLFYDFWIKKYFNVAHLSGECHLLNTSPYLWIWCECEGDSSGALTFSRIWQVYRHDSDQLSLQTSILFKAYCSLAQLSQEVKPFHTFDMWWLFSNDIRQIILKWDDKSFAFSRSLSSTRLCWQSQTPIVCKGYFINWIIYSSSYSS